MEQMIVPCFGRRGRDSRAGVARAILKAFEDFDADLAQSQIPPEYLFGSGGSAAYRRKLLEPYKPVLGLSLAADLAHLTTAVGRRSRDRLLKMAEEAGQAINPEKAGIFQERVNRAFLEISDSMDVGASVVRLAGEDLAVTGFGERDPGELVASLRDQKQQVLGATRGLGHGSKMMDDSFGPLVEQKQLPLQAGSLAVAAGKAGLTVLRSQTLAALLETATLLTLSRLVLEQVSLANVFSLAAIKAVSSPVDLRWFRDQYAKLTVADDRRLSASRKK